MELDELKNALQHKLQENAVQRTEQELEQYFRGRTASVVAKVKRNLRRETLVTILIIVIFSVQALIYNSFNLRVFCGLAVFFCIFFVYYMARLYKKITFFETSLPTVKETLQQIIFILRRFTTIYFQATIGLLPVAFVLGFVTGYVDIYRLGLGKTFHWTRGILLYAVYFICWSVITYFLTKWYIRKSYGKYLEQLVQHMKDLENG